MGSEETWHWLSNFDLSDSVNVRGIGLCRSTVLLDVHGEGTTFSRDFAYACLTRVFGASVQLLSYK